MTADILTSLELDKVLQSNKVLVIKEINGGDSSFITSCVLGHCIRNKNATLLISTHNSLVHYHNVGLKMNYNLQKSVDSKIINFYDLGNELVSNMFEDKDSSLEFMCKIKEQIKAMYDKNGTVNVIFDGVSHLFDLELTLKDINSLCKDVIDLLHSYNNSFLIFHCNVSHCDNVTNVLANLLSHKSHILVEVESLPSGLSSDVSGRLTIRYLYRKFQSVNLHIFDQKSSQYLFKLFDRGVKLLAPGTV
nr:uncharacterized protein LOC116772619 [Danaus plexippus plexippus]XP_032520754.1 uncharacterized protein LOC116772619 [Danaus plexippus plexippus]